MSRFKDYLNSDLSVFFNPDEFGELHRINDKDMVIVLDEDKLEKLANSVYSDLSANDILYRVPADVYGAEPERGEIQNFDGKLYTVFNVRKESGIYEIIIQRNTR